MHQNSIKSNQFYAIASVLGENMFIFSHVSGYEESSFITPGCGIIVLNIGSGSALAMYLASYHTIEKVFSVGDISAVTVTHNGGNRITISKTNTRVVLFRYGGNK